MPDKKTAQEIVQMCEAILTEHNVSGVVMTVAEEDAYYGIVLSKDSLFQWQPNNEQVRLSLAGATAEQIAADLSMLEIMKEMLEYCGKSVYQLAKILLEALEEDKKESSPIPNRDKKKRDDN